MSEERSATTNVYRALDQFYISESPSVKKILLATIRLQLGRTVSIFRLGSVNSQVRARKPTNKFKKRIGISRIIKIYASECFWSGSKDNRHYNLKNFRIYPPWFSFLSQSYRMQLKFYQTFNIIERLLRGVETPNVNVNKTYLMK